MKLVSIWSPLFFDILKVVTDFYDCFENNQEKNRQIFSPIFLFFFLEFLTIFVINYDLVYTNFDIIKKIKIQKILKMSKTKFQRNAADSGRTLGERGLWGRSNRFF